MARRKQTAVEVNRPEGYSLRLDPKVRFAAELAAVKERRSLASFIEWAVDQAAQKIEITIRDDRSVTAHQVAEEVWNADEIMCLLFLADRYPMLLTTEQLRLRNLIVNHSSFSKVPGNTSRHANLLFRRINLKEVRLHWDTLRKVASGELPSSKLPPGEELVEVPLQVGSNPGNENLESARRSKKKR